MRQTSIFTLHCRLETARTLILLPEKIVFSCCICQVCLYVHLSVFVWPPFNTLHSLITIMSASMTVKSTCIFNEILILISFFKLGQTFSFFTAVNDYQKAKNINEHLHKVGRCNNFWIFLYNFRQMKKSLYVRI